jgi:hypothetical protein
VQTIRQLPSDLLQVQQVKMGFANALMIVWVVMCGLAGIAFITGCFVERYALDRAITTEQGFRDSPSRGNAVVDVEALKKCESASDSLPVTTNGKVEMAN